MAIVDGVIVNPITHVVVDLQLSAISTHKKFMVLSDSNFDINFAYFSRLPLDEFWVTFILPGRDQIDPLHYDVLIQKLGGMAINYVHVERSLSPFSERFGINLEAYRSALSTLSSDIDVFFCNNPSTIAQLRLITPKSAKFIAYNHWIDSKEFPKDPEFPQRNTYAIRQAEGHLLADYTFLNSNYAKKLLLSSMTEWFRQPLIEEMEKKIYIFPPTDNFSIYAKVHYDSNNIIFNHRLSSFGYYRKNLENCIKAVGACQTYRLLLTDNSGKGLTLENPVPPNVEYLGYLSDSELNDRLRSTGVHLSLFEKGNGGMWSISIMRAILTKNAVILPNHSGYQEMVPPGYAGLVDSVDDAIKLLRDLDSGSFHENCVKRQALAEEAFCWFQQNYDIKKLMPEFIRLLK